MPSDTDLYLELAARFSILASVLVVIYFFVYTSWRIVRVPNNPWPWGNGMGTTRREIHQTPTQMPFTFKLKDESVNDLEQFTFQLSCHEKLLAVRLFWAVDASYVFKIINSSSWDMLTELEDSHLSESHLYSSRSSFGIDGQNDTASVDTCGNNSRNTDNEKPYAYLDTLHLRLSEEGKFDDQVTLVGPKPLNWTSLNNQFKYPLAIFILKSTLHSSFASVESPSSNVIVGLCVILHVKNNIIPKPTTVLAQYIKLSNGEAHRLQSLYVMSGAEDNDLPTNDVDNDSMQAFQDDNQPFMDVLCSVCQSLPVSRAIIPCRHVCLCGNCFGKVVNCPICRGTITCFFKTRNEDYLSNPSVSSTESARTRPLLGEVLSGWNNNLNAALGFRE